MRILFLTLFIILSVIMAVLPTAEVALSQTQYTLTIGSTIGGSVTTPGEGSFGPYNIGDVKTLVAVPSPSFQFIGWSGDTATIADPYAASTTITMNGDYSITANFALKTSNFSLTVSSTIGGSVTTPGEGSFGPYNLGNVVPLAAIADTGYQFLGWSGDTSTIADSDAANTTITMSGDYSIIANFIRYTLTISSTGGGSVTAPGEGSFGPYSPGDVVPLAAIADTDYQFTGWSGDTATIADTDATDTTIAINGDYSIVANFAPKPKYTLTISSNIGGSVTTPGEGSLGPYDIGTVGPLAAIADTGYQFSGWSGNTTTIADPDAANTTITMNGDYSVIANFTRYYTVTISSTIGGSVTTPGEGPFGTYDIGDVKTLVAVPSPNFQFIGWSGDIATIADPYAASTTITMNGDYSITANFALKTSNFNLTVSSTMGGSVTTPGEGSFGPYNIGTVVPLAAIADTGYQFLGWGGDTSTIADPDAGNTTIAISGDYSIVANFALEEYTLTISSTEGGSVATPGEGALGPYTHGSVVNLVAVADTDYQFLGWGGDTSTIADPDAGNTTITMNGIYLITANFALEAQNTLTISSTGGGSVTTPGEGAFGPYTHGYEVNLIAVPESDYQFSGWSGDTATIADTDAANTTITINGNYSVMANFTESSPVQQQKPDLIVTDITWQPANPDVGDMVTFSAIIKNNDGGNANGVSLALYIDDDLVKTSSQLSLRAGDLLTHDFDYQWTMTPGSHSVMVEADRDNSVAESDEDNNSLSATLSRSGEADIIAAHVSVRSGADGIVYMINDPNISIQAIIDDGKITMTVDSQVANGKAIAVNFDPAILEIASIDDVDVLYDGDKLRMADDYDDVLDMSDREEEYLVLEKGDDFQVLISIPHFSIHTIVIEKAGGGGSSLWWLIIVICVVIIGIAGILYTRTTRARSYPRRRLRRR